MVFTPITVSAPQLAISENIFSAIEENSLLPLSFISIPTNRTFASITNNPRTEMQLMAEKYQIDYWLLLALSECESSCNINIHCGDDGKSCGLFQYKTETWNMFNKEFGLDLDRDNWEHQIEMTAIALKDNKHCHWFNSMNRIYGEGYCKF